MFESRGWDTRACQDHTMFSNARFDDFEQVFICRDVWCRVSAQGAMRCAEQNLSPALAFPPLLCGAGVLMSCFSECLTVVITETAKNVSLTTVCVSALVQGVSKGCFIDSVIAQ